MPSGGSGGAGRGGLLVEVAAGDHAAVAHAGHRPAHPAQVAVEQVGQPAPAGVVAHEGDVAAQVVAEAVAPAGDAEAPDPLAGLEHHRPRARPGQGEGRPQSGRAAAEHDRVRTRHRPRRWRASGPPSTGTHRPGSAQRPSDRLGPVIGAQISGDAAGARWAVLACAVLAIAIGAVALLRTLSSGPGARTALERLWTALPLALVAVLLVLSALTIS